MLKSNFNNTTKLTVKATLQMEVVNVIDDVNILNFLFV